MKFELEPLPYARKALEPHISARTLEFHYEKHHKGYLEKLRKLIENKPEARKGLEDLVRSAPEGDLFNNAAQVWNHTFYWKCMRPDGAGEPPSRLGDLLKRHFGSQDEFKRLFADAANGEFGSGWAWLVIDGQGRLRVQKSSDAENPLQQGFTPLLTLDVWEHAYYLDYQNERARYVQAFLDHLINWEFAGQNLERALAASEPSQATAGQRGQQRSEQKGEPKQRGEQRDEQKGEQRGQQKGR